MGCISLVGIFGEICGVFWYWIDGGIMIVIGLLL